MCDDSMLKQKLISVDEKEWQELGRKVGPRNRSQWIRDKIHEAVKLPDTKTGLENEITTASSYLSNLQSELEKITSKEENEMKTLGDIEERVEKAISEAGDLITYAISKERDNNGKMLRDDYNNPLKVKTIGKDQIKSLAELYKIDAEELEYKIKIHYNLEIVKIGQIPTIEKPDLKAIKSLTK